MQKPMQLRPIIADLRHDCERNWPTPSPTDSLIWLFTEMGEFAEELSRLPGFLDTKPTRNHPRETSRPEVSEEAADVLIMLITLCTLVNIDLERAFMEKVAKLRLRHSDLPTRVSLTPDMLGSDS